MIKFTYPISLLERKVNSSGENQWLYNSIKLYNLYIGYDSIVL